jgi:hypothetical protein
MYKAMFAALLAAGLIATPLPQLTQPAVAQYAPRHAARQKPMPSRRRRRASSGHARASEEMRRRVESGQGRRQDREGNEVAAILERLQQAPEVGQLMRD